MDKIPEITDLILKYIGKTITIEESQILNEWVERSDAHKNRFNELINENELELKVAKWEKAGADPVVAWNTVQENLKRPENLQYGRLSVIRRYWQVAAAVIVIAVATVVLLNSGKNKHVARTSDAENIVADVAPGSNKAILTLSNGQQVLLDNNSKSIVAKEGRIEVTQNGGEIVYNGDGDGKNEIYNTLTVPRGGQYLLSLKDGTKVWLNSASSIRYPLTFTDYERTVDISGEVYFEVAQAFSGNGSKKRKKPFIVNVNGMSIEVLGTRFNVNAYENEADIRTTLLEGLVKVLFTDNKTNQTIIQPGEQAIAASGKLIINKDANVEEVMAWKNGMFHFNNTPLPVIMRQIERWYDVEVIYESQKPSFYLNGDAARSISLSNLLNLLKLSGVKCSIQGKKLIVHEQN